jgi:hypothetical protein
MKVTLTPLNLSLLETVARFRLMTTEQIHRVLSTTREKLASVENFSNILRRLHTRGFLGRDWVAVHPSERTAFAKPSAVWHLTPRHLRAILAELERSGRAELYEPLRDYEAAAKDGAPLAENTLRHELAITDFYAALDTTPAEARAVLWLRTSPRHPAVSRPVVFIHTDQATGKKSERRLPLNPDGFHITRRPGRGYAFFFLEMDLSTEAPEKLANKFLAYSAYHQQDRFGEDIAAPLAQRHRLPIQHPEAAPFRVLFVTPTARRRNDLLLKSRLLPLSNLFQFTTLDAVKRDPYGPIWLSKETFAPHLDEYNARTSTDQASVLRAWAHALLDELPQHAL